MKVKNIPYQLLLLLLTAGASLILGFLSFGGMFALWPILPLAFAAFGLSVAYEGEIYLQNIKGALNKLLKYDYLKDHLAKDFLREYFPPTIARPEFFNDYAKALNHFHHFSHKNLNQESRKHQRQYEKTLRAMEKWFAMQLFLSPRTGELTHLSEYEKELQAWLNLNGKSQQINLLKERQTIFYWVKLFSLLSGLFMGLGTTYLLVSCFEAIPLLATLSFTTLPIIIIPLAVIAGSAYGLLTYNTVTDMINQNTLIRWYNKIKKDFVKEKNAQSIFLAITGVVLVILALALTICTAGTWWTVAKNSRPLFASMLKMPQIIMGMINPLITGLSALIFNLQNTSESLAIIYHFFRSSNNHSSHFMAMMRASFNHLLANENWGQILNPFRFLLKITILPLRILFFLGHLISIGVTADRVPGVPEIISALLGIISEGFEDMHYFVGHAHRHTHHGSLDNPHTHINFKSLLKERLKNEHSHNHDVDLPTRILKIIFMPLYFLATLWDYLASHFNKPAINRQQKDHKVLSFAQAWHKQTGQVEEVMLLDPPIIQPLSNQWQAAKIVHSIEHYQEKHLSTAVIDKSLAEEKRVQLKDLQQQIRRLPKSARQSELSDILQNAVTGPARLTYQKNRFFLNSGKTRTQQFIENLSQRIG